MMASKWRNVATPELKMDVNDANVRGESPAHPLDRQSCTRRPRITCSTSSRTASRSATSTVSTS